MRWSLVYYHFTLTLNISGAVKMLLLMPYLEYEVVYSVLCLPFFLFFLFYPVFLDPSKREPIDVRNNCWSLGFYFYFCHP